MRPRLSYANVMSTLAVFLVLAGGTAIAANLPKNSVNSKKVKNNSLRSVDLADGTGVSGADVADGSLGATDLADGSLGGAKIADSSLGGNELTDGSVTGADLAGGAVGKEHLRPDSVDSANLIDGSIKGADVGADTLTGRTIDDLSLGTVRSAPELTIHPAGHLFSSLFFETSISGTGEDLGDGTFKLSVACLPGDVMVSGGPSELDVGSFLVESFPKDGTWSVRINPRGAADQFRVTATCALQAGLPR